MVKKIDTSNYGNRPRGIKRSPKGEFYFATIEYGNRLLKINSNFEVVDDAETGLIPYGIAFSNDGGNSYMANPFSDNAYGIGQHSLNDLYNAGMGVTAVFAGGGSNEMYFGVNGNVNFDDTDVTTVV